jgi:hypothetical protein
MAPVRWRSHWTLEWLAGDDRCASARLSVLRQGGRALRWLHWLAESLYTSAGLGLSCRESVPIRAPYR